MNAPESMSAAMAATVEAVLAAHHGEPGALLPILHDVQAALGYVPAAALPIIGAALNLSRAEVHGVVTYYHHFRTSPPAAVTVQVCRAEACQARGGEALAAHVAQRLGCGEHGHRSADGRFAVEPVYCLGLCASGPALMVNDRLHARMTSERFDALVGKEGQA